MSDKLGKREKLREFYRNSILDAARHLFREKGFAGTTMDDIAKESEYSRVTVYKYFKNKEDIFSTLLLENMVLLKESIESAIKHNSTLEGAYMAVCHAHVDFQESQPLYFETMIGPVPESKEDNEVNSAILEVGEQINDIINAFLQKWMMRGKVRPDIDTLQASFALWSGICGMIVISSNRLSHITCMGVSREEFLDNGFRTFLGAILTEEG